MPVDHRGEMELQGGTGKVQHPDSIVAQMRALSALQQLPLPEAIGAACSFLLHCALNHRTMTRRVLNEKVIRSGFRGESLLDVLKRAAR